MTQLINLNELSDLQKERRRSILSELHKATVSEPLEEYFAKLKKGKTCNDWSTETFIEGARCLTDICGPDRRKFYNSALEGLHYPNTYTELWNDVNSEHPITFWDLDFRRTGPPGWNNKLEASQWVIRYEGEKPLSAGLNDFVRGPATLDCGMFCQLIFGWLSVISWEMRYSTKFSHLAEGNLH